MAAQRNKKCNFIYIKISTAFRHLGYRIAEYPLRFIFIPVVFTIVASTGFFRLKLTTDIEYLFFTTDSRIMMTKSVIQNLYPENHSDYDISRSTEIKKYGMVIATAKNEESMLQSNNFEELHLLDQTVLNITIMCNGQNISFRDICSKTEGKCINNNVLNLRSKIVDLRKGRFQIRYPVDIDPKTSQIQVYALGLGGVTKNEHGIVKDFKAVRLVYVLGYNNRTKYEIATLWEEKFLEAMKRVQFEHIKISMFSGQSNADEFNKLTIYNIPILIISQIITFFFVIITCMTRDCVSSKPWIGVAGYLSSLFGVATGFGLLLLFGVEYVDMNIAVPLVVLGVGMDDSFVILSSWRRTNPHNDMKKRMGDTYSESAISITITTVTNVAASLIGFTIPYRLTRIICRYMAISFLFSYIYQLTFLGGCLVLSGYREIKNLHAITCLPVKKDQNSGFLKILTVGITNKNATSVEGKKWNFYRDVIGNTLEYRITKCIIIIGFFVYISFGIYFTKFLEYDFKYTDLYYKNSYGACFVEDDNRYFSEYRERIQVVIDTPLDYSNSEIQQKIENMTVKLENVPNMSGHNTTESWLRTYIKFIKNPHSWFSLWGYNMSHPEDFVEALHNVFLKFNMAKRFQRDIIFDEKKKNIIASRFFVNSGTVNSSAQQVALLQQLFRVIDSFGLNAMVYCYDFLFADSLVNVSSYVIQTICASAIIVIVIFLIFIPNLHCVVCISFCVLSVVTCTISYGSVWGVTLNAPISLILILIAGFCVDYVSHISCAYICSTSDTPVGRIKDALEIAGHPIIQGGGSTVLGMSAVIFSSYRLFYDVFKILFLVILFSSLHGMILIPVLFNIWDNIVLFIKKRKKTTTEYESPAGITSNVVSHLLEEKSQIRLNNLH